LCTFAMDMQCILLYNGNLMSEFQCQTFFYGKVVYSSMISSQENKFSMIS